MSRKGEVVLRRVSAFLLTIVLVLFPASVCLASEVVGDAGGESTTAVQDDNGLYQQYLDQFNRAEDIPESDSMAGRLSRSLLSSFHAVYTFIKLWAPMIGIFSVAIGVLIAIFSRRNKGLRKFGISLAITIPLLLILIVFGVGYLYDRYF